MPISETGFKRRTYDEILTDKIEKAKELFGEDIETSELTPLGKFIRINAYDQALTEEEAELIYYSIFPNTAFGTSLDRLMPFAGIKRNAATKSQYVVSVIGEVNATVEEGFLVGTESGINFSVKETSLIGSNGSASVIVECVESGEIGNVLAQEINTIVNPSAEIKRVIGEKVIIKGEEVESDYELRKRFSEAISGLGSCNENAIKAALVRIPTVTHAGIIVNEDNGSFECYVNGGEDYYEQIAETIFDKKPIGIKTTGNIAQEITDDNGIPHIINFSHTTSVSVYVRITIKTNTEFAGETGLKEIKSNLNNYIDNIGIGNSLILSSLYGQIHSVTGVTEVSELQLSEDGITWSSSNISANEYESCVFTQLEVKQDSASEYEVIA